MADVADGLSVHIVGSEQVGRSHTNYIALCCLGTSRWEVRKRYSEFHALHKSLKTIKGSPGFAASLPKKVLFGKLSEAVVKQREEGLKAYINSVLRCSNAHRRSLMSFLQAPNTLGKKSSLDGLRPYQPNQGDMHQGGSNLAKAHDDRGMANDRAGVSRVEDFDHGNFHDSRDQMVELVAEKMIDAFQAPVPVKGRDAENRRLTYQKILQTLPFARRDAEGNSQMRVEIRAATCELPRFGSGGRELGQALTSVDDGTLTAAIKHITAATKMGTTVKEPIVVRMGDIPMSLEDEQ